MEIDNVLICFLVFLTSKSISKKQQLSLKVDIGNDETHSFPLDVVFGEKHAQYGKEGSLVSFNAFFFSVETSQAFLHAVLMC